MPSYTMQIPNWHPAKINEWEGRHWSVKNRLKKRDKSIVWGAMLENKIPKATCKRRVELTIGLGYRQRGGDPDSYNKSLLDALVVCGLLVNDSKEWVEIAPVKYERGEFFTRITLTDLRKD